MKLNEALDIIKTGLAVPRGYRIHFEERKDGMLHSDYFPGVDEPLLCFGEAKYFCGQFVEYAPRRFVNVYLVNEKFAPINDFVERKYPA